MDTFLFYLNSNLLSIKLCVGNYMCFALKVTFPLKLGSLIKSSL